MEYLGFWVTHDGVKPVYKNTSNRKYESTNFLKIGSTVYRCGRFLMQYVGKMFTYISAFQ